MPSAASVPRRGRRECGDAFVGRLAASRAQQERCFVAGGADEDRDVESCVRGVEWRDGQHVVERGQSAAACAGPFALAQEGLVARDDRLGRRGAIGGEGVSPARAAGWILGGLG